MKAYEQHRYTYLYIYMYIHAGFYPFKPVMHVQEQLRRGLFVRNPCGILITVVPGVLSSRVLQRSFATSFEFRSIVSGKPKGHGSYIRTFVGDVIQSLYRILCPCGPTIHNINFSPFFRSGGLQTVLQSRSYNLRVL